MARWMGPAGGFSALIAAAAVLAAPPLFPPNEWKSRELADHALAGTVWDTATGRPVLWDELVARAQGAAIAILGEVHDNPDHHRIQLRVLEAIVVAGGKPALAMEQFDRENQGPIDAYLASEGRDADGVADAGKFNRKGWAWDDYRPLVALALKARLALVAGNLSRTDARTVGADGFAFFGPDARSRLALARAWSDAQSEALRRELVRLHCGDDPGEPRLTQMSRAQRARDALLADALLAHRERGAVLITGNAHASRSMGVPRNLAARDAKAKVFSLGILEVEEGKPAWRDYVQDGAPSFHDFDIVVFTPRADRKDPCAGFAFPPAASTEPATPG